MLNARQLVADSLAQQNRFEEAFGVQREITARSADLHRAYARQGAQLRLIEQQAHAAELRAEAFAEAALRSPEGWLMTPRRTGTDGFFVSVLKRGAMS